VPYIISCLYLCAQTSVFFSRTQKRLCENAVVIGIFCRSS